MLGGAQPDGRRLGTLGGIGAVGGGVALVLGALAEAGGTGDGGALRADRVVVAAAGGAPQEDDRDQADDPFEGGERARQSGGLAAGGQVDRHHGGQCEQQRGEGAGAAFAAAGDPGHPQPQQCAGAAQDDQGDGGGAERRTHVGLAGVRVVLLNQHPELVQGGQAADQADDGHTGAGVHELRCAEDRGRDGQPTRSAVGTRAGGGAVAGPRAGGGGRGAGGAGAGSG